MNLRTRLRDAPAVWEHHLVLVGCQEVVQGAPDQAGWGVDQGRLVDQAVRLAHAPDRRAGPEDYLVHPARDALADFLAGAQDHLDARGGYLEVGLGLVDCRAEAPGRQGVLADPAVDLALAGCRVGVLGRPDVRVVGRGVVVLTTTNMKTKTSPCARAVCLAVGLGLVDYRAQGLDRLLVREDYPEADPGLAACQGAVLDHQDGLVVCPALVHALAGCLPRGPDRLLAQVDCLGEGPDLVDCQAVGLVHPGVLAGCLVVDHAQVVLATSLKTKKMSLCVLAGYPSEERVLAVCPVQNRDRQLGLVDCREHLEEPDLVDCPVQGRGRQPGLVDCREHLVGPDLVDYLVVDLDRQAGLAEHLG